jgi:hypothetical protein
VFAPIHRQAQRCCGSRVDTSVLSKLARRLFAMIATAPGAAPKAVSALRQAEGRQRTVLAQEREQPSNPTPAGLEPALRTAPVQAPGPARSPTSVVPASGMKALPQARLRAKARLLR